MAPVQLMAVQLVIVLFIPFFYQAFLQISCFMCNPIGHPEWPFPMAAFIRVLEKQLEVTESMRDVGRD